MSRTIHLHSGIIIVDPSNNQFANSLTISNGQVSAIDQNLPSNVTSIDLRGQTLMPGLVDSHLHLVLGSNGVGDVDLSQCHARDEFEYTLSQGLDALDENEWLIASGWSEQSLGAFPSIEWLACAGDVPTLCWRSDFHCAIVNLAVLTKLDLDELASLVGGSQYKEGVIKETALWNGVCPLVPKAAPQNIRKRLLRLASALHVEGITMVGAMEHAQDVEEYLWPIRKEIGVRMRMMLLDEPTPELMEYWSTSNADAFLSVSGFKSFIDGTLGSRTAKMYDPYLDAEGDGVLVDAAADDLLITWVQKVSRAGFAPILHAIGDRAVGLALSSLQNTDPTCISRIEHAQFIADRDLSRVHGQWFGVQPLHKIADDEIAMGAVGEERMLTLHNWRRMLDAGAKLSFGSDWPVAPHKPIQAIGEAIRNGLTPSEALVASTVNAAASLREKRAGHLSDGCFGDVVVLNRNPLDWDGKEEAPVVTMTIVNGTVQYQQESMYE